MKKLLLIALGTAALLLNGCATPTDSLMTESAATVSPIQAQTLSAPAEGSEEGDPAIEKYIDVLEGIYYDNVLPDGQQLQPYTEDFNEDPNEFAVIDIDGDGENELLVRYITTYTAGMFGAVYGYDRSENQLTVQLMEFPALSFYPNGIVEADWSHNQGLAGRFWPCTLYRYDSASDSYFPIACVDAWDREFFETDFDGNPFPVQADPGGENIVYYIYLYGQTEEPAPVSQQEFDIWYYEMIGFDPALHDYSDFTIKIPFLPLTEANILSVFKE